MPAPAPGYRERLRPPLRWWVQVTMLLASLFLAFAVAMPLLAAVAAAVAFSVLGYGVMLGVGRARIEVTDGRLCAGRARIALDLLGEPEPLDAEATRRVHGVEADARAFLLTRPYLKRSVRVPVLDPADPTPYWLLSTRHPERLAAAIATGTP